MELSRNQQKRIIDLNSFQLIYNWVKFFSDFYESLLKNKNFVSQYEYPFTEEKIKFGILSDLHWIYKSINEKGYIGDFSEQQDFVVRLVYTLIYFQGVLPVQNRAEFYLWFEGELLTKQSPNPIKSIFINIVPLDSEISVLEKTKSIQIKELRNYYNHLYDFAYILVTLNNEDLFYLNQEVYKIHQILNTFAESRFQIKGFKENLKFLDVFEPEKKRRKFF